MTFSTTTSFRSTFSRTFRLRSTRYKDYCGSWFSGKVYRDCKICNNVASLHSFNKLVGTRCFVIKQATLLIFENFSALFFRCELRKLRSFSFTVPFSFVGFPMLILWFFSRKRLKLLRECHSVTRKKGTISWILNFYLFKRIQQLLMPIENQLIASYTRNKTG